jgi:hypothetical protein
LFLFNILLSAALATVQPEIDEHGWVRVARPEQRAEVVDQEDHAIWVVFAKQLGSEKILISFPEDPQYRYLDPKGQAIEATAKGEQIEYRFQALDRVVENGEALLESRLSDLEGVRVFKTDSGGPVCLTYWQKGLWVQETFLTTPYHTYFFQTQGPEYDEGMHQKFVSSFDVYTETT